VSQRFTTPYAAVLHIKPLRRLLFGIGVSSFGDGLSTLAITWLTLDLAAPSMRAVAVSWAIAAYSLPAAAGSIVLARFVRTVSGRRLAIVDGLWRACFLLAVPVAYALDVLNLPVLLALIAVSSLFSAWGKAGRYVLLDELVPVTHTQMGNSAANVILEGAYVTGPLVAAALLGFIHPSFVIGLDALTFLVLVAVYAFGIRDPERAPSASEPVHRAAGCSAMLRSRTVLLLVGVSLLLFLLSGPIDVAIPVKVTESSGVAGHLAGYLSAFGAGGFLGALLGGYLRQKSLVVAISMSVAGVGAFSLLAGILPVGIFGWTAYCLAGLCWGPFPAATTTLLQKTTPRHALSSVLAARAAVQTFALPLGALIAGPAIDAVGPVLTVSVSCLLMLAVAVIFAIRARAITHATGQPATTTVATSSR
jgi:DHA3 family macrolide efflux protein-like MFS transporter